MRIVFHSSCLVLSLAACSGSSGSSHPRTDAGNTPDVSTDASASPDAVTGTDVVATASCTGVCSVLADGGISAPNVDASGLSIDASVGATGGYLRFLNLARGTGTVRFEATSASGFPFASVSAVVPEGAGTPYIFTIAVPFLVDAFSDPGPTTVSTATDGGMDDGELFDVPFLPTVDASTPVGTLTPQLVGDVYIYSGCTVILSGAADGSAGDQTNLQLWKITDVPMRSPYECVGLVRVISAMVGPTAISVQEGSSVLVRDVSYVEPFGFREVCAGQHLYTIKNEDNNSVIGTNLAVNVVNGAPQTLYVWGDTSQGAGMSAHVLLTDDLPPGR